MKKTVFTILFITCFLFSLCSCTISDTGATLYGFTKRMNELNESYSLTDDGYIIDQENQTFTKYFTFNEKNVMLTFSYNEKNELDSMNIVSDSLTAEDSAQLEFIKNCIYAFVCNEEIVNNIFTDSDFDNAVLKVDINTKKTKSGNVEMLIDVTEIGTVITVLQSTP